MLQKLLIEKKMKKSQEHEEKYQSLKSFFNNNTDAYEIHKISEYLQ